MSQSERGELYRQLKDAGYTFSKHFREYTLQELKSIYSQQAAEVHRRTGVELAQQDPSEMPSQRRGQEDLPIRSDLDGKIWFQEEIVKKGQAAPRGYRIHREMSSDTKEVTITTSEGEGYTETFEVAGENKRPMEARVGTPTWQVGKYRIPHLLPFMVVCYREAQGYDRLEVEQFFGGPDVLPENIQTVYVGNLLCYDIRSVNIAIQREHNLLMRKGAAV